MIPMHVGFEIDHDPEKQYRMFETSNEIIEKSLDGCYILAINTQQGFAVSFERVAYEDVVRVVKEFKETGSFDLYDRFQGCKKTYSPFSVAIFASESLFEKHVMIKQKEPEADTAERLR